jgi:hypothetical protein
MMPDEISRGARTAFGAARQGDALPESLRDNAAAAALHELIDLDLDAIAAIQPPLGYGGD